MTNHELYLRHGPAIGCDSYGTFCKLLELLDAPASYKYALYAPYLVWVVRHDGSAASCILRAARQPGFGRRRVVLLDGTVIREWTAGT